MRNRLAVVAIGVAMLMAMAASLVARAVTRRYERGTESANAGLGKRVAARTEDLARALNELQLAHDRLVRGEKMTLLGELMSGIAHELRSPLTAIMLSADLISAMETESGEVANEIIESCDRAMSIISNLLAFARNHEPVVEPHDLARLCRETSQLLATDLRNKQTSLELDLAENLLPIPVDRQQIQQVVLNLLTNSLQAIADEPLPREIRLSLAEIGDEVQLDVSDSGPGVPEDRRDSIFDAFFTTKGEGTGLGLSLCRRFVEAHDGTIELLASPRGAHFRVCLPTKDRLST